MPVGNGTSKRSPRQYLWWLGISLWLLAAVTHAATSVLSDPIVTDVTDRSFAIVWTSSERANPSLVVYADAAASQLLMTATTEAFPVRTGNPALTGNERELSRQQIISGARDQGVMKVVVGGLAPSTTYYIKLVVDSQISQQTTVCPDSGTALCPGVSILQVTTEVTATRDVESVGDAALFNNDQLLLSVDGAMPGDLLIVGVEGARGVISRFIGDGVPLPAVVVDLNNLYDATLGSVFHVRGSTSSGIGDAGEVLIARHYRGNQGSDSIFRGLPAAPGSGAVLESVEVAHGDCNRDERVDSYDRLLIGQVVVNEVSPPEHAMLAFHPLLCDLYRESGQHSLVVSPVLDVLDISLLEQLLVGSIPTAALPQAP